jgi:hypothetical protein
MMEPRRFLRAWALFTIGLLAAAAGFNVAVDPYVIWGAPTLAGFNRDKPEAVNMPRLAKPYLVERVHPATLLLGSSRIDAGLDAGAAVWPASARPVFNLGVPGSSLEEHARLLGHVQATADPGLIVVGVSFDDSMIVRSDGPGGKMTARDAAFYELLPRLRTDAEGGPNPEYWPTRLRDAATALLSLDATAASLSTVLGQGAVEVSAMTPLGNNTRTDYLRLARTDGELRLFLAKDREKAARFLRAAEQPGFDTEPLARLLADAGRHGAKVLVMVTPGHVDELELIRQTGLWGLREAWLRRVAAIVGAARRDGARVALWDFSAPGPYVTEKLPPPGDAHTPTRWFWETDHFKPALGTMMAARMLGGDAPDDFGTQLDGATLEPHIAAVAASLDRYEAARPDDIARVARIVAAARAERCARLPAACTAAIASR